MNKTHETIYFDATSTEVTILFNYINVKEQLPFKYKCFALESFGLRCIENSNNRRSRFNIQ